MSKSVNAPIVMCLVVLVCLGEIPARSAGLPEQAPVVRTGGMSQTAWDIAQDLGVVPIIEKLQQYKPQPALTQSEQVERLKLSQALTSKVLMATLEVRDVTARIEREMALINRMRGVLEDRRDRAIKLNSIENIVASGGVSEIGTASAFLKNQVPGNAVQLVASALTMGLGGWALREQSGGKHRVVLKPNMLAQVFNFPTDNDSVYPASVWAYLNRSAVGARQTRLQGMLDSWREFKVIPRNTQSQVGQRRIGILTNTSHDGAGNIDTFNDQSDMLFDLRSEIFQMDRDLLELMQRTQEICQ